MIDRRPRRSVVADCRHWSLRPEPMFMNAENHRVSRRSAFPLLRPAAVLTASPITLVLTVWHCNLTTVRCIAAIGADLVDACNSRVKQIASGTKSIAPARHEEVANVIPLSHHRASPPKHER